MTRQTKISLNRDDQWLLSRLDFIWSKYFDDIPQKNRVYIKFGKFAKYRLGSIRLMNYSAVELRSILKESSYRTIHPRSKAARYSGSIIKQTKASLITITSMFKDPSITQQVIDHTIGHELVHYAHGFSSVHPRLHRYPHAGGVVKKEMEERGMGYLHQAYKEWIKDYRKSLRKNYGW